MTDRVVTELPVDQIELDKSNPRISKYLEMYGEKVTAEQISLALGVGDSQADGSGTTFQSLKASIRTYGGIIHPILVNRTSDGRLVVIEGNTRVAIYKEFREKKIPGNWDTITSIVYDLMSQTEIDGIRLQAHLVGPRAWDPYSKAKYIDLLRNSKHLTLKQIVDYCGGREREVADYIEAYEVMESSYRKQLDSDDEFDPTRFSAFVELQRPSVKQAIVNTGFTLDDFARWVKEHRIHPLNTVRQLPRILGNPKSRKIFLSQTARGAIQEALKVLEAAPTEVSLKDASLLQLAESIFNKILKIEWGQLQSLKADPQASEAQALLEARDQLVQLCKEFESE
jgi:hypothetical protein